MAHRRSIIVLLALSGSLGAVSAPAQSYNASPVRVARNPRPVDPSSPAVLVNVSKLPKTVEEQMQLLREREPAPEAKVKELEEKRLAVTKEKLVKSEGIQDKRLPVGAPKKPAPDG